MMTTLSHRYRDLGALVPPDLSEAAADEDAIENIQLAAFENGYQAGWEDAVKAQAKDAGTAAAGIAQNLQDMSFTHREAYLKLSAAMKPLLMLMVNRLLPPLAQKMVGAHILEQLVDLMDAQAENAIEIAVCPDNLDDLQEMLSDMARVPFTLSPDPILDTGQAYLRVGGAEQEINLNAVLSGISEALDAFFEQTKEEIEDG